MKCRQVREMMGAYLYGDLTPDGMRELRLHTQICDGCRKDLEERGRVVASLGDAVPELSDEDKMRIAWSVKGAVRQSAPVGRGFQWRWGSAIAAALLVIAGLAVGAHVLTHPSSAPPVEKSQANGKAKPKVTVEEVSPVASRKHADEPGPTVASSQPHEDRHPNRRRRSPSAAERTVQFVRENAAGTIAWRGNGDKHAKDAAAPNEPAQVVETPDKGNSNEGGSDGKLPKPVDLDNAKTTPEDRPQ